MYCQTCGKNDLLNEDVIYRRYYYWHIGCYVEYSFPSNGKIIPDSILTPDEKTVGSNLLRTDK
jgi:hypothetical protein